MTTVVGVPKEVKDNERRVSMQPDGITELTHHGHEVVVVQAGAGGRLVGTEAVTRVADGHASEEVYESVHGHFGEKELVDLTMRSSPPTDGTESRSASGRRQAPISSNGLERGSWTTARMI